jgi:hypothetical protein
MYDVDLFDTPIEIIEELQERDIVVICYFSAGSLEDWREDAPAFPPKIIGANLDEWEGEYWLDIRQLEILLPIMQARLDLAVEKGCDGVEPDNVDAYANESGFDLSREDQVIYNRRLAIEAHERGLSIGLKNALDLIEELELDFDWALNEQCFQYEECEQLLPFVEANKAVFGVEYVEFGLEQTDFCSEANALGFSWLYKTLDLADEPPNGCWEH